MKHLFLKSDRTRKTASDAAAIVATVVLFVSSAAFAETYYFVGGSNPPTFATASNWARADGTKPTSNPSLTAAGGNVFVFTNTEDVVFDKSLSIATRIEKRGPGAVKFDGSWLSLVGATLVLEEGDFGHWSAAQTFNSDFSVEISGTAGKRFYLHAAGNKNTHLSVTNLSYMETAEAVNTMTYYWYGIDAKTMTFKGAENSVTRFSATMDYQWGFSRTATFDWNPDYSSAVLEIIGRNYNKPQGAIRVSNGTLRFTEGAGVTSLSSLAVAGGATLEIANDIASSTFGCPLTVEAGGALKIAAGVAFRPTSVTYDGVALPDGRYSKRQGTTWIDGDGVLVVGAGAPDEPATTYATWTGNGGGDTSVLNPANWGAADNETLPDLTAGSLEASFPTGTEASVPADETVAFKGISVSAPSFTLKGGEGSKVALGSSGVTVTGAAFTNECFAAITRSQTWSVAENCRNVWAGEVAADWPTVDTLTLNGDGRYVILASNPNLCNVNYSSTVEARSNVPLGGQYVTVEQKAKDKVVECYGVAFSNKFATAVDNGAQHHYNLITIVSGVNEFFGEVKCTSNYDQFWRFADNTSTGGHTIDRSVKAVFKGGYYYTGTGDAAQFSPYWNGVVDIEDTPMSVTRMYVGVPRYYLQELNLNVASNTTTRGIHVMCDSVLNTTVADALYATDYGQSGVLLNDGAVWNLSADQGINVFGGITNTATVSSESGATLHLRDDRLNTVKTTESQTWTIAPYTCDTSLCGTKVQTNKVVFAGNVNFSKEGALDHWMEGVSTSTGGISVSKGKLVFSTGSWKNASGVNVSVDGVIEIRSRNAFGKDTPFVVTGESTDGKIVIPPGVSVRIESVTVNGRQISGTVDSGLVTGGGKLIAGKCGLMMIFR